PKARIALTRPLKGLHGWSPAQAFRSGEGTALGFEHLADPRQFENVAAGLERLHLAGLVALACLRLVADVGDIFLRHDHHAIIVGADDIAGANRDAAD